MWIHILQIKGYICTFEKKSLGLNFLDWAHWSVAQAGSNDEKNAGRKILLDCPFKVGPKFWAVNVDFDQKIKKFLQFNILRKGFFYCCRKI